MARLKREVTTVENLKEETLQALAEHGKTIDDVRWIGTRAEEIPVDDFLRVADREYDEGYGGAEVRYIFVVGDDWWLERGEYDGSEWWEFKTMPTRPTEKAKEPLTEFVFDKQYL